MRTFLGLGIAAATAMGMGSAIAAQPDLSGIWGGNLVAGGTSQVDTVPGGNVCPKAPARVDAFAQQGNLRFGYQGRTGSKLWITFEQDCGVGHRGKVNHPQYKPQYWQEIRLHDYYANTGNRWADYADPNWEGIDGVPRMGPPNKIIQTPTEVAFFYQANNVFRIIPTDCKPWDAVMQYDQTSMGLAAGCFLDDGTLVVKATGFAAGTWLDWSGFTHSSQMTVTETFKKSVDAKGVTQLLYNVLVEDPVYLMEPWNMGQRALALQTDPTAQLLQDVPYVDRSLGNLVDPQYRG